MKKVLTIAGSDSIGGAGIQADIKTMTANNVYAMSAITALTAQNTTGVTGIVNVAPEFVKRQLEMISAIKSIQEKLFPLARVITPNIPEAEVLSGISIKDDKDMLDAAKIIYERYFCAVLLKGGHSINDANDLLYENKKAKWFLGKRIDNKNTHGTGCSLSSAIASNLAKGYTLEESVQRAKNYISDALLAMLDIGKGSGPLNHAFNINGEYAKEAANE